MKKFFALSLMALAAMFTMAQTYPNHVYLTGSATPVGWSTSALPMFNQGDGTYEYVGMLYNGANGNEFKMLGAADWLPSYGPVAVDTTIATGGNYNLEIRENYDMGDRKFKVPTDGRYHLTLNLAENKLYVDTATNDMPDKNGIVQVLEAIYIVGNGTGAGWDAAKAFAANKAGEGVFTITTTIYGHNSEEQYNEFKFLSSQSFDMPHIGPAVDGEVFTGAGTYTVSVFTTGDKKWHNTTTETKVYDFTVNLTTGSMTVAEHQATGLQNAACKVKSAKYLRNGQLYIVNNEEVYTATGVLVK